MVVIYAVVSLVFEPVIRFLKRPVSSGLLCCVNTLKSVICLVFKTDICVAVIHSICQFYYDIPQWDQFYRKKKVLFLSSKIG